jgi:A/G-specific adenine glycosylase
MTATDTAALRRPAAVRRQQQKMMAGGRAIDDMTVQSSIQSSADAGGSVASPDAFSALLTWYQGHGRRLGFRQARDPWAILVSEVMLQQTQVRRVELAWPRFIAAFPTPRDLAQATPAAVLRAWEGLGYNRRAVNLQRAARAICGRHGGRVPSNVGELEALAGVGRYTARAVAAIAFDIPVAAIDTNLRRVLGRVLTGHGREGDAGAALAPAELQREADRLVARQAPGAWTHALMDVGASICHPKAPDCGACPLLGACLYAAAGDREARASHAGAAAAALDGAEAVAATGSGAARGSAAAFPSTMRWLRGRIIDRLRQADDGAWVLIDEPIGIHGADAVASAIAGLERDGLLERSREGGVRLPSAEQ